MMRATLEVVGVYVGEPTPIGEVGGKPVISSLVTRRLSGADVELTGETLAGNVKSKPVKPDNAVYFYPTEHYPSWQQDGFTLDVGGVGENVATAGLTEEEVRIGDVWRWGDAQLQVSKPRAGCYKLALHTGRKDVNDRIATSGRSGWYMRVLRPGTVPTTGALELLDRPADAPSVADACRALHQGGDRDFLSWVLAAPALGDSWRTKVAARHRSVVE